MPSGSSPAGPEYLRDHNGLLNMGERVRRLVVIKSCTAHIARSFKEDVIRTQVPASEPSHPSAGDWLRSRGHRILATYIRQGRDHMLIGGDRMPITGTYARGLNAYL